MNRTVLLAIVLVGAAPALAGAAPTPSPNARRAIRAVRAEEAPRIDGVLDDAVWERAEPGDGFVQQQPADGLPSRYRTQVRVAFDDHHLYVAGRMLDPDPEAIRKQLARRDADILCDLFAFAVDSYHDRRTAYAFFVNASGVQRDLFLYDDTSGDDRWDAVWRSAVAIDDQGWSAEIAVPLSQLRFNGHNGTWGVQFMRLVARDREVSIWQPIPRTAGVEVSGYGHLMGMDDVVSPRRLELLPYVASGASAWERGDPVDPFDPGHRFELDAGLDLKYGLGSNWTLDATLNPDFGQVEADPARVNLTDTELFLEERRPFFLEGVQIFGAPDPNAVQNGETALFYSRRIGGAPVGEPEAPDGAEYVDRPTETRILGAAKVSGRSQHGTSVGVLEAVTAPAWERYADLQGRRLESAPRRLVQPLTSYLVVRGQQELAGGHSQVGLVGTATHRGLDAYLAEEVARNAYVGGLDWNLGFKGKEYFLIGRVLGSRVGGAPGAMESLQRSPLRYAQRPDAEHLGVDPERTSLSGVLAEAVAGRRGGRTWNYQLGAGLTTPFFEVNDLGFQTRADELRFKGSLSWQDKQAGDHFQELVLRLDGSARTNLGGDFLGAGVSLYGWMLTVGHLPFEFSATWRPDATTDRLLRGGPLASMPGQVDGHVYTGTDTRKRWRVGGWLWGARAFDETFAYEAGAELVGQPAEALMLTLAGEVGRQTDNAQYVDAYEDPAAVSTYGERYVFADIDQVATALAGRVDWTFSPRLSLQTYVRGTVVTGDYGELGWFSTPGRRDLAPFESVSPTEDGWTLRAPASDVSYDVEKPDFTFTALQANAVLRWEWRPGSALFFVYQMDCGGMTTTDGVFDAGRWTRLCSDTSPTHTALVKATWWWSP